MPGGERGSFPSVRLWVLFVAVLAIGCLLSPPPQATGKTLVAVPAFKLRASAGYSIVVVGGSARGKHPAVVLVLVRGPGGEVTYSAPATAVSATSIQADLGSLGRIDVAYSPSGRSKTARSSCGGGPLRYDAGFFEGTIEFSGEEGYTEVTATRAPIDPQFVLDLVCPGDVTPTGSGPGLPGAELRVRPQRGDGVSFVAHKNTPGSRAGFTATVSEKRDGIGIARGVSVRGLPGTFRYRHTLRFASVRPPAPFSGSAVFSRSKHGPAVWSGSLAVDFPGRSNVSLTAGMPHAAIARTAWGPPRR